MDKPVFPQQITEAAKRYEAENVATKRRVAARSVDLHRVDMCREIARAVAADLLRNEAGDVAKRLVLELENGHDGGGWSRAGIESRVEAVVKAHIVAHERDDEARPSNRNEP